MSKMSNFIESQANHYDISDDINGKFYPKDTAFLLRKRLISAQEDCRRLQSDRYRSWIRKESLCHERIFAHLYAQLMYIKTYDFDILKEKIEKELQNYEYFVNNI